MNTLLRTPLIAAVFAAVVPAVQAAPFVNGSLESSVGGSIETVAAGGAANSWTVSLANVEFVKSGYSNGSDTVGAAAADDWFVDLNGTQGPGRISQTFDTVAGQWYRVDYAISGNAGPDGTTKADGFKSMVAEWNGVIADSATYLHHPDDNWNNLRWEAHAFLVQASASSSTLGFRSTSAYYAAAGPFVDAVSVTAVPEPAMLSLWLAGLAGVTAFVRKRV